MKKRRKKKRFQKEITGHNEATKYIEVFDVPTAKRKYLFSHLGLISLVSWILGCQESCFVDDQKDLTLGQSLVMPQASVEYLDTAVGER